MYYNIGIVNDITDCLPSQAKLLNEIMKEAMCGCMSLLSCDILSHILEKACGMRVVCFNGSEMIPGDRERW